MDGVQHFEQVSNWKCPIKTQKRDIRKMKLALDQNMTVIRLLQQDVYKDKNNWEKRLFSLIKQYKTPKILYLDNNDEYKVYKQSGSVNATCC